MCETRERNKIKGEIERGIKKKADLHGDGIYFVNISLTNGR